MALFIALIFGLILVGSTNNPPESTQVQKEKIEILTNKVAEEKPIISEIKPKTDKLEQIEKSIDPEPKKQELTKEEIKPLTEKKVVVEDQVISTAKTQELIEEEKIKTIIKESKLIKEEIKSETTKEEINSETTKEEINSETIRYDDAKKVTIFEGKVNLEDKKGNKIFSNYAEYNKISKLINITYYIFRKMVQKNNFTVIIF